jgi:hypothetical protein
MRVSPGDIRSGLFDVGYRIPPSRPPIVSTHSQVSKAVRVFHQEGSAAARAYLENTFATSTWTGGGNATKARIAKQSVHNYIRRASTDPRTVALGDTRATVTIAGHQVAAGCDVVLLDDGGYEGRVCIWAVQSRAMTIDELALLACPIVLALGNELGDDLVLGVDVWSLRADTTQRVTADRARAALPNLNTLIRRIAN